MKAIEKTKAKALDDIRAGLREARQGDFATDAEVAATIAKFITLRPQAISLTLRSRAQRGVSKGGQR